MACRYQKPFSYASQFKSKVSNCKLLVITILPSIMYLANYHRCHYRILSPTVDSDKLSSSNTIFTKRLRQPWCDQCLWSYLCLFSTLLLVHSIFDQGIAENAAETFSTACIWDTWTEKEKSHKPESSFLILVLLMISKEYVG